MSARFSFLFIMLIGVQCFVSGQDVGVFAQNLQRKIESHRQKIPQNNSFDNDSSPVVSPNFYQEAYDAFIANGEAPESLKSQFDTAIILIDVKQQQIRQKTFLMALFYQKDLDYYKENCVGSSYSEVAINYRQSLRQALVYKNDTQEENKTFFFKTLLDIDKTQDNNPEDDSAVKTAITQALTQLSGNVGKTLLERWNAAIKEESDKKFIEDELTTSVSGNLNRKLYDRIIPFLFVIILPGCLYLVNTKILPSETATFVEIQQNHTKLFSELLEFTNQFSNTLFSAAYCLSINSTIMCNITRYDTETKPEASVFARFINPAIVIIASIIKFGHQMIHEIFYFLYWRKGQSLELIDQKTVDVVYENIKDIDRTSATTTLSRIKEFLPGLLKKRTWGFDEILQDRITQIKK